jgi:hypothetical protein
MTSVQSPEQLTLILSYIVPGLIILYVRAQFLTGRLQPHKDALLSYFTLSILYIAITQAVTSLVTGSDRPLTRQTPYALPIMLTGAAIFGALIGLNAARGATRRLLGKLGILVPHAITNAWDWRFTHMTEFFITVTLKDGSKVHGWCGNQSFFGAEPENRDLLIEQVYEADDRGKLVLKTPGHSIYISSGEARMIELFPRRPGA